MTPRRYSAALKAPSPANCPPSAPDPRPPPSRTANTTAPARPGPAPSRPSRQSRYSRTYPCGSTFASPGTAPSAPSASARVDDEFGPGQDAESGDAGMCAGARSRRTRKPARSPLESLSPARTPSAASSRTSSGLSLVWTDDRQVVREDGHGRARGDHAEVAGDLGRVGAGVEGGGHHDRVRARRRHVPDVVQYPRCRHVDGPGEHGELPADMADHRRRRPAAGARPSDTPPPMRSRARTDRPPRPPPGGRRA